MGLLAPYKDAFLSCRIENSHFERRIDMIIINKNKLKLLILFLGVLTSSCGQMYPSLGAEPSQREILSDNEKETSQPKDSDGEIALEDEQDDVNSEPNPTGVTENEETESELVEPIIETALNLQLPPKTLSDIAYGDHERQKLDVFLPKRTKGSALPVAMMVHGGGWFTGDKAAKKVIGYKKDYFHARGYAFVSINYRLAPDDMYPAAPNDVASSLAWLKEKKDKLNIDTSKVILIGHSAGAHLVNLVVTNGRFLSKVNFERNHIKAFISLDTYFYDIKQSLGQGGARAKMILNFFGTSTQKMEDGSPLYFVDAKTPPMLNFNRISDAENISVRKQYISKIEGYGKLVSGKILVDYSHSQINELFGKPDDIMTNMSDKFLEKLDL